jgi:Asp-tRNA(Asn)/Glu-tRNA(Gln) amidotransferase A subunit family amidase
MPLSFSLDHTGPIARTVADAAMMLDVVAGFDARDRTSANVPVSNYFAAVNRGSKPARIGVPRKYFYDDLDAEITAAVEEALGVLKELGGNLVEIEVEVSTDRTLQTAESYAYHKEFVTRSPELYQAETLRRIRRGENVTVAEAEQARRDLERERSEIKNVFRNVDFLVTPTTPIPAPAIEELKLNPDLLRPRELVLLRNTRPVNVWGLPAISVPCGFTAAGLPIGLQIIGPHWGEENVFQLAHAYEQATVWHKRRPNILATAG